MSSANQVMVTIKRQSEMTQYFRAWPEDISLAICLQNTGECVFCAFHHSESAALPRRLVNQFGLGDQDISFSPAIAGYPEHNLPYSDEQSLATLIYGTPGLLEEAEDYAANFSFALEERLDPANFMQAFQTEAVATDPEEEQPDAPNPALEVLERAIAKQQTFAEMMDQMPLIYSVTEHPDADDWVILECETGGAGWLVIGDPKQVYLRDDRKAFSIHLDDSQPEMTTPPHRIRLRSQSISDGVWKGVPADQRKVRLTQTQGFMIFEAEPPARSTHEPDPQVLASLNANRPAENDRAADAETQYSGSANPFRKLLVSATAIAAVGAFFLIGVGIGLHSLPTDIEASGNQFLNGFAQLLPRG